MSLWGNGPVEICVIVAWVTTSYLFSIFIITKITQHSHYKTKTFPKRLLLWCGQRTWRKQSICALDWTWLTPRNELQAGKVLVFSHMELSQLVCPGESRKMVRTWIKKTKTQSCKAAIWVTAITVDRMVIKNHYVPHLTSRPSQIPSIFHDPGRFLNIPDSFLGFPLMDHWSRKVRLEWDHKRL